MKALDIISQFNRFDGKDVTKETLKAFRGRVQQYTDSVGHGPYMNQLRDILIRVGRAISVMDKNREEAVHLEVKPVKALPKKKKISKPKPVIEKVVKPRPKKKVRKPVQKPKETPAPVMKVTPKSVEGSPKVKAKSIEGPPKVKPKSTEGKVKTKPGMDGLVSASELSGLNFKVFDLDGKYRKDFQRLHSDTQVMVWGSPGSGKTVYLLEFAQYLADKLGLNVLYVANEEFGRSTFVQKIKQFNIGHPRLKFSRTLNEKVIDQFDAIIFDSINSLGYTLADWKKLVERNPNKLMIPVVQSTKDGDFRGGKDWEHEVDVAGEIKNRKLILRKNRLDSNNAKRAEQLNKEAAIEEAKKKAEIRNAVKASIDKPKPPTLTAQAA